MAEDGFIFAWLCEVCHQYKVSLWSGKKLIDGKMSDRQIQTVVSPDKRNCNIKANTSENKNDSASNTLPLEMYGTNQEVQRFVTPEEKKR